MSQHAIIPCVPGPNEELRYALRSIAKHCPWVEDVTIYGGAPDWYAGRLVRVPQTGTPARNTTALLRRACRDDALPEEVVLWNDDFFAVRPTQACPVGHRGLMREVAHRLKSNNPRYATAMLATADLLEDQWGYPAPRCFEVHMPMVVRRPLMGQVLARLVATGIRAPHKRSVYGNVAGLDGPVVDDVKLRDRAEPWPDGDWISTNALTFRRHASALMDLFPDPSPWEKP